MAQVRRWHIYPDPQALHQRAADAIVRVAAEAIARHGRFTIVLAGGNTPREVYRRLGQATSDWSRWHIYLGDERCVPVGHGDRNDVMARVVWLDRVPVPQSQIYPMPAEHGPDEGARRYSATVAPIAEFDLTLLGIGADGHTASLFPDHPGARSPDPVVGVRRSPKPPPERVSLGVERLSRSAAVYFLVAGAAKRGAIRLWANGGSIPAATIAPPAGVDILVDRSAMPGDVALRF